MRIALGLEYDGSSYCGWQTQPDHGAIQDHVERALTQLAAEPITITAAGRTDAGVHALQQVVHFDTNANREQQAWIRGTNTHLPANIRILWAVPVAADFHARFSARSRSYDYWLLNDPVAPAIASGRVGWFHSPMELEPMQEAVADLLGEHDFSSFRSSECQAKSPVRTMEHAAVSRHGNFFHFHFRANAFLHHMVRNLVGSLVYVGCGRQRAAWLAETLAARNRALAAPTFAPDGLYLSAVTYEPKCGLPESRSRQLWPES